MMEKTLKQIIREELQKLSGMSLGQRVGYIWDYYKPLMAALLGVIFLICIGVEIYQNKQIEQLLSVYMINNGNILADSDALTDEFADYIGGLKEKQQITIDTSLTLGDENSTVIQTKFMVLAAANELELLLMDETTFDQYYEQGFFTDLTGMLAEEQLEEWADLLVYREKIDEDVSEPDTEEPESVQRETASGSAEEIIAAIDLSGSPVLQDYGFYQGETVYGCIYANSEYKELYGQFFTFLLEK